MLPRAQLAEPHRGAEVLGAMREPRGGSFGLYVEPSAAVAAAAVDLLLEAGRLDPSETIVLPLTGPGLKNGSPTRNPRR